jgi:hypothetical protein
VVDEISIRRRGILRRCGEVEIDRRNCPMISLVVVDDDDVVDGGMQEEEASLEIMISSPSK